VQVVADQSAAVLNAFFGDTHTIGVAISYHGRVVINIIFACTAVQAMVIFIGIIVAIAKVDLKRRIIGLTITLIPIYLLNLLRNAMVGFLVGEDITDFFIAHNVLSKIGALLTLIVLLFIIIKLIPEIYDEINCIIDLHKRNGPLEQMLKKALGRKSK
jgi:archaeosortase A (PGF-CTERM-specific)